MGLVKCPVVKEEGFVRPELGQLPQSNLTVGVTDVGGLAAV